MAEITIRKILVLLQSEYPNSFVNMDARTMQLKINLWESEFKNDDINLVYAAVRLYMKDAERFAPSIGQIRNNMRILLNSDREELSDQDAWALVSKACSNSLHHSREEFEKLPEEVQRAVGSPEQLKAWARMEEETVQSVIASNFKKTFRATQERQKKIAMVSPEIRQMVAGIAQSMGLAGADRKQIEHPKPPKLMPAKLEPMVPCPKDVADTMQSPQQKEPYTPPDPDEWERRREEAMKRLNDLQTERIEHNDRHDSRALQGDGPDLGGADKRETGAA